MAEFYQEYIIKELAKWLCEEDYPNETHWYSEEHFANIAKLRREHDFPCCAHKEKAKKLVVKLEEIYDACEKDGE